MHFFVVNDVGTFIDLTGQRFGRLVAIEATKRRDGNRSILWHCLCNCGKKCFVSSRNLKYGSVQSCGCLQRDAVRKSVTKHGMSRTRIYKIWQAMIQRCENPNDKNYKYYGGRDIKVCDRWHTFENFYADVGERPKGKSLDRWPNNSGNYEPTNWRWASKIEQANNTRALKLFLAFGPYNQVKIAKNQHIFAKKWGLSPGHISDCLLGKRKKHKGWQFQKI